MKTINPNYFKRLMAKKDQQAINLALFDALRNLEAEVCKFSNALAETLGNLGAEIRKISNALDETKNQDTEKKGVYYGRNEK